MDTLAIIGYKTIWGKVNSNNLGLLQARRRVFALSIYDPENKIDWGGIQIKTHFEKELEEIFNSNEYKPKNIQHNKLEKIFDFENKLIEESELSLMKNTPSRVKMRDRGMKISIDSPNKISTITTKQDRWPNAGNIEVKIKLPNKNGSDWLKNRFITPRESYKLMGFVDVDYERAKKQMERSCVSKINARDKLYRQAGNSIAVNALEVIFYYMDKINKEKK